ncbi:hypothetical protein MIN45_P2079 [Methylomarinovum tepidoasis]|uniref:Molybdenum carrier n=1 Tax=Methylomarinovum tepidoasis TaxID=2840183 RepID=A0AAU9CJV3_9GAMM|nr:putative molybdenum carrier protein [Methylomarinovum sp. IN45]BCX89706.1 hypothetical protein MIN45_P2079 [Methylomarinovum sp. IN45]
MIVSELRKVVSGGQTGVDRAALDTALERGIACDGWCPQGRLAEDGPLPPRYPLTELPGGGSRRTRANVADSDATLIVYFEELRGGTLETLRDCLTLDKPFKLIDAALVPAARAAEAVARFLGRHRIEVLNVAGPRASQWCGGYAYARELLIRLLAGQRTP